MFFKNLQLYRITAPFSLNANSIHEALKKFALQACPPHEMQSEGWISPRQNDLLVHAVNQQLLLRFATEKKLLPSSVINQVTKARAAELEEQQGYAPGRKAMKELKERVHDELLPRAFSIRKETNIWIDPVNGWLGIDTSTPARSDDVVKYLLKCFENLSLEALRTKTSPQAAMTLWLSTDEAPHSFTIDQDAELKSSNEDKATVRYVRHTLDPVDIKRHIDAGKLSTKLAMTWNDRISFVLTEKMDLRRIKPLQVMDDTQDKGANEEERFDSDFTLMAGELAQLLQSLVDALDGIQSRT